MGISADPVGDLPFGDTCVSPQDRAFPYLVQAGATLTIAVVRVALHGEPSGTGPKIRGMQSDGFDVAATELSAVGDNVYEAANLAVVSAFPSDLTAFYDTFDIAWEVSLDGSNWTSAGSSRNQIYTSLVDPITNPTKMLRSAVDLAISNQGATDGPSAFAKTWALLNNGTNTGPGNIHTWDKKKLYYYEQGYDRWANTWGPTHIVSAEGLLAIRRGQCGAWTDLMRFGLTINGVVTTHVQVDIDPDYGVLMFVKNWSSLGTFFYFQSTQPDMIPTPGPAQGGTFGYYDDGSGTEFKNDPGVAGQNSGSGAPSEKTFQNHQFVGYDGAFYDPSYGRKYTGLADFQAQALLGYGTSAGIVGANLIVAFVPLTASSPLVVKFHS